MTDDIVTSCGLGNILHIVSGLFYGGGQQVALDLVRILRETRGDTAELCILGDRSEIMATEADHVVTFDGRYNRLTSLAAGGRRLRRVLRKVRPSVLHTHGWDASMVGAIAAVGMDIGQVTHWHTTDEWLASRAIKHAARRRLTNLMLTGRRKRIVAVSAASRDHLCRAMGWKADAVQVVRNGIDVERFRPLALPRSDDGRGRPIVIGTVSRLASGKGLQFLIEALEMLHAEQRERLRLHIAGEGGYRAELERQVEQRGLQSIVSFAGHVEPAEFYRTLDVFVLPSLTEGLPLCVLEAMASGCATIATSVGGVPEIITDGVDGLLAPQRDAAELKRCVERFVNEPDFRRDVAERGRKRIAAQFSLNRVAGEVAGIYETFRAGAAKLATSGGGVA